jgi:TPR repeat protein
MIPAKSILLALILSLLPVSAFAGFEDAFNSYREGDKAIAFQGFKEAAEAGDIRAFGKLGGMYLYGIATQKDFEQAYVWFSLAYMTGDQYAERFQSAAASQLMPAEILELQVVVEEKAFQLGLTEPEPTTPLEERPAL